MKFDIPTTGLFRIKKNGHFMIKESLIFRNEELSVFGITEIKSEKENIWAIIHIPSERAIISKFNTKQEAEEYWDILAKAVNLDSLLLCIPKFEFVKEQIQYDVEISYKKYRNNKGIIRGNNS